MSSIFTAVNKTMKIALLLLSSIIFSACVSKPDISGLNLSEQELKNILKTFESDCNCGDNKATLIALCSGENDETKESACYEVFTDTNHPIAGQPEEKPLYCSVHRINKKYFGKRMAREGGQQITVLSGCVR